jgi:hypothetical protein
MGRAELPRDCQDESGALIRDQPAALAAGFTKQFAPVAGGVNAQDSAATAARAAFDREAHVTPDIVNDRHGVRLSRFDRSRPDRARW